LQIKGAGVAELVDARDLKSPHISPSPVISRGNGILEVM